MLSESKTEHDLLNNVSALRFLIIDGYPKQPRDELQDAGMKLAWELYTDMLLQHLPQAVYEVLLPSDPDVAMPSAKDLHRYAGIIWTGCNLTIYDTANPSVSSQIELAKNYQKYEKKVYMLPKNLDEEVARLHLDKLGVKLTKMTQQQADYIGVPLEGPYKPDHYRY